MISEDKLNPLPSLLKPLALGVPADTLMVSLHRSARSSSSREVPEPEPELPPQQLVAWTRVVRRLRRLARVRRLWGVLGGWLRVVKARGWEEFEPA